MSSVRTEDFPPLRGGHLHQEFGGGETIRVSSFTCTSKAKVRIVLVDVAIIGQNMEATSRAMSRINDGHERQHVGHGRTRRGFIRISQTVSVPPSDGR